MNQNTFSIGCWTYFIGMDQRPADMIRNWVDLGITTPLSPDFGAGCDKQTVLSFLDECLANGIHPYLHDYRVSAGALLGQKQPDYDAYRQQVQQAVNDFGAHPALSGFFICDEPDREQLDVCLNAVRIHRELAPHLHPFLNLLPLFENDKGLGERIGLSAQAMETASPLAGYLDNILEETGLEMIGYDCYTQQYRETRGWGSYFSNLRQYRELVRRHPGVCFNTTLLCVSHFDYVVESEEDFRWQINTAAAMGAKALWWFYPDMRMGDDFNYRDAPINPLAERTPNFTRMSTEIRLFMQQFGRVMPTLSPEDVFMTEQSFGGIPLFTGEKAIRFADVLDKDRDAKDPLLLSFFRDAAGTRYLALVNCARRNSHMTVLFTDPDVTLERLNTKGEFVPLSLSAETRETRGQVCRYTSLLWLAPGQMNLYKIGGK